VRPPTKSNPEAVARKMRPKSVPRPDTSRHMSVSVSELDRITVPVRHNPSFRITQAIDVVVVVLASSQPISSVVITRSVS
jgi:hypothetical protein